MRRASAISRLSCAFAMALALFPGLRLRLRARGPWEGQRGRYIMGPWPPSGPSARSSSTGPDRSVRRSIGWNRQLRLNRAGAAAGTWLERARPATAIALPSLAVVSAAGAAIHHVDSRPGRWLLRSPASDPPRLCPDRRSRIWIGYVARADSLQRSHGVSTPSSPLRRLWSRCRIFPTGGRYLPGPAGLLWPGGPGGAGRPLAGMERCGGWPRGPSCSAPWLPGLTGGARPGGDGEPSEEPAPEELARQRTAATSASAIAGGMDPLRERRDFICRWRLFAGIFLFYLSSRLSTVETRPDPGADVGLP